MWQSVQPGRHERAGYLIVVTVSKGLQPVLVPNVKGTGQKAALALLAQHHLVGVVTARAYSESVTIGRVIDESPASGLVKQKTKVSLVVSLGPHPRRVPDLSGLTFAEASARLATEQLNAVQGPGLYSTTVPIGQVIGSEPAGGATTTRHHDVVVHLSLGPPYVTVPKVRGLTIEKATALLRGEGLKVSIFGPTFSNRVFASYPGAGKRLRQGQTVTLYSI
jgi:serine/threonine-protein kinase